MFRKFFASLGMFLHHTADEAIWAAWLYFHPFSHMWLADVSAEYVQKRSEVIQRFRRK